MGKILELKEILVWHHVYQIIHIMIDIYYIFPITEYKRKTLLAKNAIIPKNFGLGPIFPSST